MNLFNFLKPRHTVQEEQRQAVVRLVIFGIGLAQAAWYAG